MLRHHALRAVLLGSGLRVSVALRVDRDQYTTPVQYTTIGRGRMSKEIQQLDLLPSLGNDRLTVAPCPLCLVVEVVPTTCAPRYQPHALRRSYRGAVLGVGFARGHAQRMYQSSRRVRFRLVH